MKDNVKSEKIRCDACPVMCYIADGNSGACDRYANHAGELVRLDPLTIIQSGYDVVPFLGEGASENWDGDIIKGKRTFVTAVGAVSKKKLIETSNVLAISHRRDALTRFAPVSYF